MVLILNQSAHENRIYSLNIHCGDSYPDSPPAVHFVSKINLPCVDRSGKVGAWTVVARDHLIDLYYRLSLGSYLV
jgi:ubiquitin-protein ligase